MLAICDTDEEGNTHQLRTLDDGSEHIVLKNFADAKELNLWTTGLVLNPVYREFKHFWMYQYEVKVGSNE